MDGSANDLMQRLKNPGSFQLAAWTLELARSPAIQPLIVADPQLFALLYASCASAVEPPAQLVSKVDSREAAVSALLNSEDGRLTNTLRDLQRQFGPAISGQFAGLFLQGLVAYGRIEADDIDLVDALDSWAEKATVHSDSFRTSLDDNLERIRDLLGLGTVEFDILRFQFLRHMPGFNALFSMLMSGGSDVGPLVLSMLLGHDSAKVWDSFDETAPLVSSGLVAVQRHPFRLSEPSDFLRSTFESVAEDEDDFISRFVRPLTPEPTTASLARLDKRDSDILRRMMKLKLPEDRGLHALVYGPADVDKQDLVSRELTEAGFDVYGVQTKEVPQSALPVFVNIAQHYLDGKKNTVLVVRRAEQALARRTSDIMVAFGLADRENDEYGKASDESLTGAHLRCVWLCEDSSFLTEKNLGRFLFHCEALTGSRADRRTRIAEVVSEFGLSDTLERELAKYTLLGTQQVRQAAVLGSAIGRAPEDTEAVVQRAVQQAQKALGRDNTEDLRDSVTTYSLDNLNLSGKYDAKAIIKALKKRQGKGGNTLCFYGIPGAGKTQLAEFMAVELDLPVVMKRASDLLSKWLGESEKAIAEMFREAEAEGALLFLDEADSFLRDRSLARAEWSVTQVNELLQQMERFPGVFIAATNLFQDLDAAALRRFTFKVEFLALTDDQAWTMFKAETGYKGAANSKRTLELREQVSAIANLTPGDFATVKRQANIMGEDELSVDDWVTQLREEAKVKMHGLARNKLGFGNGNQ